MGKKYVIELEDEPFWQNDDPKNPHGVNELWRVKGFSSLVFDSEGLSRMTPLDDYLEDQEKCKKQKTLRTGDEVMRSTDHGLEFAYVLIPNYLGRQNEMVLLMQNYIDPQIVCRDEWIKTTRYNYVLADMIAEAAGLIKQENEPCQ